MTKVYQCDRCKRIFEPRYLNMGEPYIARKNKNDLDLCPECYDSLMVWLKEEDEEVKCLSCKFKNNPDTKEPCKFCSHCWQDLYEEAEND